MAQGVRPRSDRQGVCKAAYDFAVLEATDLSDGERDMVRPSAVLASTVPSRRAVPATL